MLRDTTRKQLGCQMQACKCGVWPREGATKRTQAGWRNASKFSKSGVDSQPWTAPAGELDCASESRQGGEDLPGSVRLPVGRVDVGGCIFDKVMVDSLLGGLRTFTIGHTDSPHVRAGLIMRVAGLSAALSCTCLARSPFHLRGRRRLPAISWRPQRRRSGCRPALLPSSSTWSMWPSSRCCRGSASSRA